MPASTLRDLMVSQIGLISAPHDQTVPPLVQTAVANAITTYITGTVRALGSYVGVIPPAVPESAPVDTWNIVGAMTPCSVPSTLEQWMLEISNNIRTGFYYGLGISHPLAPTIAFPTMTIAANQAELYSIHMNTYENPQGDVLLRVCEWITTGLQTGFMPIVAAGIAGTGTMTISEIIV